MWEDFNALLGVPRPKDEGRKMNNSKTALLIIDMINTMDFPGGEKLRRHTLPCAKNILKLKQRYQKKKIPIIYVNDNFGHWRSSWSDVFHLCSDPKMPGAIISNMLRPDDTDYFILKPKHSGFYATCLQVLLESLKIKKLILTGIAGNICVFFTANDAHMRGYDIHVPANCVASNTKAENDRVLQQMKEVFGIKISDL